MWTYSILLECSRAKYRSFLRESRKKYRKIFVDNDGYELHYAHQDKEVLEDFRYLVSILLKSEGCDYKETEIKKLKI